MTKYLQLYDSPVGVLSLISDEERLMGVWFSDVTLGDDCLEECVPVLSETKRWLDRYFLGQDPGEPPALHLEGTPFQLLVWSLLLEIPYGQTQSYGAIARRVASLTGRARMSAQAVGGAVGSNPVSILVPCHRVVGSDGRLTGYAGGLDRKRMLLSLERALVI